MTDVRQIRESVACTACGATPHTACIWPDDTPPPTNILEDGVERRPVHAIRYAATLPKRERVAFWNSRIGEFLKSKHHPDVEEDTIDD